MVEGLARRLRLAGYDCASPPEVCLTPQAILERARAEGRVLLTTSGGLEALARPGEIVRLPEAPLGDWVRQVTARFPIDFAGAAFSRCSRDNAPLDEVPWAEVAGELPPRVRQAGPRPVRRCPVCRRLYWPGSHLERIRRQFKGWTGREL
jgi:uncharacterized protein with PIN domain